MAAYHFEYFEYDDSVLFEIDAEGNAALVESPYQNHRQLCSAMGEWEIPVIDGKATLPEAIHGHPLVRIWQNALENISCEILEIPSSVSQVSSESFLYYDGCFEFDRREQYRCRIGAASVPADHPTLEVIDGALFHRDRKELLFFPIHRKGHYAVPEGTKRIAPFAFCGCELTGITLPESLEYIGEYAFLRSRKLQTVDALRETVRCHADAFRSLPSEKLTPEKVSGLKDPVPFCI